MKEEEEVGEVMRAGSDKKCGRVRRSSLPRRANTLEDPGRGTRCTHPRDGFLEIASLSFNGPLADLVETSQLRSQPEATMRFRFYQEHDSSGRAGMLGSQPTEPLDAGSGGWKHTAPPSLPGKEQVESACHGNNQKPQVFGHRSDHS